LCYHFFRMNNSFRLAVRTGGRGDEPVPRSPTGLTAGDRRAAAGEGRRCLVCVRFLARAEAFGGRDEPFVMRDEELVTRAKEFVTRDEEFVTRAKELVTRDEELVTRAK
jgi:hypothetical protein